MRRILFPDESKLTMQLPVRTMGIKISSTAEQIEPIRKLDRFFLQGGSPQNNSFMYISGAYAEQTPHSHPLPLVLFYLLLHCQLLALPIILVLTSAGAGPCRSSFILVPFFRAPTRLSPLCCVWSSQAERYLIHREVQKQWNKPRERRPPSRIRRSHRFPQRHCEILKRHFDEK